MKTPKERVIKDKVKIKELEERIRKLEQRPQYIPVYPPQFYPVQQPQPFIDPNHHYHGTTPCYRNPCVWS